MRIVRLLLAFGCLLLLCSCSTTPPRSAFVPASELPATVAMNEDAGRGNVLIVPIRLEHGNEMPFIVDTGAPVTCVDESLASGLGKRLVTGTAVDGGAGKHKISFYPATKLYLGNTQLMTGSLVATMDLKFMSSQIHCPVMGVLGMDCMRHYCIQLDFEAEQVRFLDPDHLNTAELGKPYPLIFSSVELPRHNWSGPPCVKASPLASFSADQSATRRARRAIQLIDVGNGTDGASRYREPRRRGQRLQIKEDIDEIHTNENTASFDKCVWDGETYTNLTVVIGGAAIGLKNIDKAIGLRFLARHLVTFNFPQRVMYLKQTSTGPLPDIDRVAAWKFILASVRKKGGLPGGPPDSTAYINSTSSWPEDSFECVVCPKESPTRFHYAIARSSVNEPWKLQKAWKTDAKGRTIEEYPVP